MENHWTSSMEWDNGSQDSSEDTAGRQPVHDNMSPGTYHCKSALRSHQDNMKLFLYRRDYNKILQAVGGDAYDDQFILLLPRFWRCFYYKDAGVDGIIGHSVSRQHSSASVSFSRWSDPYIHHLLTDDTLNQVMQAERQALPFLEIDEQVLNIAYKKKLQQSTRVLYLMMFLNLSLVVLNHKDQENMPDISVELGGIVVKIDEGMYTCKYNDFIALVITQHAVKISLPGYSQIVQKDLFLTLCDKITERFNVMIGCHIIENIASVHDKKDPDSRLSIVVHKVLQDGDDILLAHRNRGYDLLSKFEAYCVATILTHDDDRIWDSHEFLNNMLEDDRLNSPDLYESALSLINTLKGAEIHQLSEIHGLWRLWGHPIIDLEGGMKKMEQTCLKQPNIDRKETLNCVRTFKLTFFTNYFRRHHHYPLSNISPENLYDQYSHQLLDRDKIDYEANQIREFDYSFSYIWRCIKNNKRIDQHSSLYKHADWDRVVLLQNFQLPRSINIATMVKDKAISMTRSELTDAVRDRNSVFDSQKRRGVLRWLSSQAEKIYDFLRGIDDNGLPDDDLIIGLYPKEREMKTKARFFSLMSYKLRMYVTATEEFLGKYVLRYFPMITMSDTLLSMIIRLYDMTTNIGENEGKVTYSMNIDFSKWNQNMRERTNDGVFKNLDRIMGFRSVVSRTHALFRSCYLYLCSGEYIPHLIRGTLTTYSPWSRTNDESGKEGLRQKGWTITTVCDILSLAFVHKAKIELIGGGDNQVLTVSFAPIGKSKSGNREDQLKAIRSRMEHFRNSLAKKMDKRGLPLKLEETWISHSLLMYNKIMYYNGVPLRGRLKIISRIFGNSNVGVTSLGNIASTIGTGFQSLSAKDYTPCLSWAISRYFTHIYMAFFFSCNSITGTTPLDKQILRSQSNIRKGCGLFGEDSIDIRTSNSKLRVDFTTDRTISLENLFLLILYYHKILGGPGIGPPTCYMMKGFPDPLSEGLSFNYKVINHVNMSIRNRIVSLTRVEKSNIMHWEHLLEDPVSINHSAPPHGVAALRQQAEQVIKNAEIKNREFKKLVELGDNEYLRQLSEVLCSGRELEPRLLHDIAGATIPGFVNSVVSRVDQSTTINKIAGTSDVVKEVYYSELKYYIYLANKLWNNKGHTIGKCPTEDSRMLRNWTWGKRIIGVTTPHPSSFLDAKTCSSTSLNCDHSYIMVNIKRHVPSYILERGQFRPYFGSYTEEKFKMTTLASAYGDESVLRRAIKIQKLLGWRYMKGGTMYNLIQKILSCVTDADPDKFLPVQEEITGDVEHRYHDMATKHGGIPTNLIHLYTTTSCNTSTFTAHSKGSANESLHFQAAIIYACMSSISKTIRHAQVSSVIHYHEACDRCIQKIELPTEEPQLPDTLTLMSCPTNSLMYVKENDIPIHYHNVLEFNSSQSRADRTTGREIEYDNSPGGGSWLLLIISTLLSSETIKSSVWKLIIERLTSDDIYFMMKQIIFYRGYVDDVPYSQISLTYIRDILEGYLGVFTNLLDNRMMTAELHDQGYFISDYSDIEDMSEVIFELKQGKLDSILVDTEYWNNQSIRYQDPHRSVGIAISCSLRNPSVLSCPYCIQLVKERDETMSIIQLCNGHGPLNLTVRYHLYSLDKLSKSEMDVITHITEKKSNPTRKRRRLEGGALALLYSKHADALKERRVHARKNNLLFNPMTLARLLNGELPDWRSVCITSYHLPTVCRGDDLLVHCNLSAFNWVDKIIGKYICEGLTIWHVLERELRTKKPSQDLTRLKICYMRSIDRTEMFLFERIMGLLQEMVRLHIPYVVHVEIVLAPSYYDNIEVMDMSTISDLHHRTAQNLSREESFVYVNDVGDRCLNTAAVMEEADLRVMMGVEHPSYITDKTYIISEQSETLNHLDGIRRYNNEGNHYSVTLLLPQCYVTDYKLSLIYIQESSTIRHINLTMAQEALENMRTQDMKDLSRLLTDGLKIRLHTSLTWELYKEMMHGIKPITSFQMMNSVLKSLSNGIMMEMIHKDSAKTLNWRSILLIKMMIAVLVLTHTDRERARLYYTSFYGASISLSDDRKVLLHKKSKKISFENCYQVGMTRGVLGSKLNQTIAELGSELHITTTFPHELSPRILLLM